MKDSKKESKWIERYGCSIARNPSKPGVWKMKKGGYFIRARATDPRTGKLVPVKKRLRNVKNAFVAYQQLQYELEKIRAGQGAGALKRTSFGEYSVSLLETKVAAGKIRSAKSKERWCGTLTNILIPRFGPLYVDSIRRADILDWTAHVASQIEEGKYRPTTANGWLAILRVVINAYVFQFELERNPVLGIRNFEMREHPIYTCEDPNALLPAEVPPFLAMMLAMWPQHFALVALGFGTGLRPSSLRPLRRHGPRCDVIWEEGELLIRRSHTKRQEIMETTKTGVHQRLKLPAELMEILRWHVENLRGRRVETDLLFPGRCGGGLMTASALATPFRTVCDALQKEGKLRSRITPRGMRRTFQDLARQAELDNVVTRSISGHATEEMQRHYSTVSSREMESGIGKVISLSKAKDILDRRKESGGGTLGGTFSVNEERNASRGDKAKQ